jgi:hypothetical protein
VNPATSVVAAFAFAGAIAGALIGKQIATALGLIRPPAVELELEPVAPAERQGPGENGQGPEDAGAAGELETEEPEELEGEAPVPLEEGEAP